MTISKPVSSGREIGSNSTVVQHVTAQEEIRSSEPMQTLSATTDQPRSPTNDSVCDDFIFPAFSFLTSECLALEEAALGRLVLNLHAPADDYCPYSSVTVTKGEVSVIPFPRIVSILSRKKSRFATHFKKLFSSATDQGHSVPEFVVRSAVTSKLLNSSAFFDRLIQDEDTRRWLESVYRLKAVYLVVGIHSFSDAAPQNILSTVEHFDSANIGSKMSPFITPGNRIIGVRYRRVQCRAFRGSTVDSAFLQPCGRWSRYVIEDSKRGNEKPDSLEAILDARNPFNDLCQDYDDCVSIYQDDESGEDFVELVS